jgi:hypothetical protein
MDEPLSVAWRAAKDGLVDATGAVLSADVNPPNCPQQLFHFSDLQGMVGILESRTLWASLATSLSDQSEVSYGLSRARALIQRGEVPGEADFLQSVERFLDPNNSPATFRLEWRTFIISFCSRVDLALQWLHYGRNGSGVVLAVDAARVRTKPFDLVEVLYEEARQDLLIRSVIKAAFDCLQHHIGLVPRKEVTSLASVAAHLTAQRIWMAAPRIKNHAFAEEREWRLITYDLIGQRVPRDAGIQLPMRYRVVARRIIPYMELSFDTLPITELILGAGLSMLPGDPGLAVLVENTIAGARIMRSEVPVRE